MPHFTLVLSQGAPMIDLVITASAPRLNALQKAGVTAPTPRQIRGLLDTGASHTCIDPSVFDSLGLQPTGNVAMLTPSTGDTPMQADTYDVGIVIPNGAHLPLILHSVQVSASQLASAQGFHALVGRDILAHCILIYNGTSEMLTLSY